MRNAIIASSGFVRTAFAAICFAPAVALSQIETPPQTQPAPGFGAAAATAKRGPSYEAFTAVRKQCETEVPSGKAHGNVCARAASLLLAADPPDGYGELSGTMRIKAALRLLEIGVASSDIAAGRAFDLYNNNEIVGYGYADSFRAKELLDIMMKRTYPGAALRTAQANVSFYNITVSTPDKTAACETAKKLLAEGKLDADSKPIANGILDSGYCSNLPEYQRQPKQ